MNTNIITHETNLGNMRYPFLSDEWTIVNTPLAEAASGSAQPTLRWVKDNMVSDLHAGQTTDAFLAATGLRLSLHKGPFVLSKRLSRVMRPFRYFAFFPEDSVTLYHNRHLDQQTWDGCGLISRAFVRRLADARPELTKAQRRELLTTGRFEITVMHVGGQEKGDVIVTDMNADLMFPAGSAKREIALENGTIFVGLDPRHARDDMRLDIQSLVNLHPFFSPEQLIAWARLESEMFLHNIKSGKLDGIFHRLGLLESATDLDKLTSWWLAEYLVSGGQLMWFNGTIAAMARQHLNRLQAGQAKSRWPVPGGRYYIMPAEVGGRDVPDGMVELDPAHATAWVSTHDWNDHIVNVLGGCDGDDAVWVFGFTDTSDNRRKLLLWRSPNQLGEYIVLEPTAGSHELAWPVVDGCITWPAADSALLPPRIDQVQMTYGEIPPFAQPASERYTTEAMETAIAEAEQNAGVLGAYCNILLTLKAVTGELPTHLPARLEDVIDGTVKAPRNMTAVWDWIHATAKRLARGRAVPASLTQRFHGSLTAAEKRRMRLTQNHWLDVLNAGIDAHIATYTNDAKRLGQSATLPAELLTHADLAPFGQHLAANYHRQLRRNRANVVTAANALASEAQGIGVTTAMIGLAHHVYTHGMSDRMLWQNETAPLTIQALRGIGLIGEPVWTDEGAVLWYEEPEASTTVTITFNGVWFNWLKAQGYDFKTMGEVPADMRERTKHTLTGKASCLVNRMLSIQPNHGRLVAHTDRGLLFGFVSKQHNDTAAQYSRWRILSAAVMDGNVTAILAPVTTTRQCCTILVQ